MMGWFVILAICFVVWGLYVTIGQEHKRLKEYSNPKHPMHVSWWLIRRAGGLHTLESYALVEKEINSLSLKILAENNLQYKGKKGEFYYAFDPKEKRMVKCKMEIIDNWPGLTLEYMENK